LALLVEIKVVLYSLDGRGQRVWRHRGKKLDHVIAS
jgi:hypothetical protein